MRVTRMLALGAMLGFGCTERSPSVGGSSETSDAASSSESTQTSSTDPSTSAEASDAGMSSEAGDPVLPYPDCRQSFDLDLPFGCSEVFGHPTFEVYSDFACAACLCAEGCATDGECFDPGAAASPRCLISPNGETLACYLVCERDDDCPPEMVCIPRYRGDERACHWPWLKPECCEEAGGPVC